MSIFRSIAGVCAAGPVLFLLASCVVVPVPAPATSTVVRAQPAPQATAAAAQAAPRACAADEIRTASGECRNRDLYEGGSSGGGSGGGGSGGGSPAVAVAVAAVVTAIPAGAAAEPSRSERLHLRKGGGDQFGHGGVDVHRP